MPPGWMSLDTQPDDLMFGGEKSAWPIELTKMQRLYGFIGCYVGGAIVSIVGIVMLLTGHAGAFAALFAIGLCISLLATGFLLGFGTQIKLMFKPVRIVATIILFVAIAATFATAFAPIPGVVALICAIIAYLAMLWYSLSYIPYARKAVKGLVSRAV